MFFVLIIPFLLLIVLPKSQARSIERQYLLAQKRAQAQAVPTPKPTTKPIQLFQDVHIYVLSCLHEFSSISSSRKKELEDVARYISQKLKQQETVNLIFICTHNSRRSQLAQIWAAVAAANYGVRNVHCFSGGTEETSFAKRAVETLKQAGLKIDGTVGTNPRYTIRYSDEVGALDCFSKKYDHAANPQKGFAALMTCSDADVNCPFVPGAEVRYKLTYEDPKLSDRTPQEAEVYEVRSRQIATEMLYLFSHVS
ncbi:MAG: protein-tyrosine-phosphatase [Flavobacteriales bacterium]|nr:protein-tyrosine-phosphatase [Flavobacteriales bacterium]